MENDHLLHESLLFALGVICHSIILITPTKWCFFTLTFYIGMFSLNIVSKSAQFTKSLHESGFKIIILPQSHYAIIQSYDQPYMIKLKLEKGWQLKAEPGHFLKIQST